MFHSSTSNFLPIVFTATPITAHLRGRTHPCEFGWAAKEAVKYIFQPYFVIPLTLFHPGTWHLPVPRHRCPLEDESIWNLKIMFAFSKQTSSASFYESSLDIHIGCILGDDVSAPIVIVSSVSAIDIWLIQMFCSAKNKAIIDLVFRPSDQTQITEKKVCYCNGDLARDLIKSSECRWPKKKMLSNKVRNDSRNRSIRIVDSIWCEGTGESTSTKSWREELLIEWALRTNENSTTRKNKPSSAEDPLNELRDGLLKK